MSVVATSVFLLFALIVLGFILGKRNIIHKESIPDLSALVLQVTMPVTVFCSIIDQERSQLVSYGVQTFLFIILLHLCALLVGLILIHAVKVQDLDQGVWIYSMLFSNNGFMGIPLALSVFGGKGMFLMALGNVVGNFLIFSVGVKLLTWKYPMKEKLNIRKMIWNNINIAVLLGLVVCILQIPVRGVGTLLRTCPILPVVIHAGGGAVYLKAFGESSFSGLENAVSDADQTADISIAYDRISATASDKSGRDIEKCADSDGSIAGFFRAVHDYGTIWHQYGSGGAIGVYDNVI